MVATATKALQDQLFGKDLPFLDEHAGRPFTYAVLKGRSNYLCLQRATRWSAGRAARLEGAGLATPLAEVPRLDRRLGDRDPTR